MAVLNLKESLYNTSSVNLFTWLFALVILGSCNRIKEVEVRVLDINSMDGVAGVKVYYLNNQFTTDSDGKVILEGRNMEGTKVSTNLGIKGYTTPDSHTNCEIEQSYTIESSVLLIPLRRLKVLKLKFSSANNESKKGCLIVNDLEHCNSKREIYYEYSVQNLIYPTGFNKTGNEISMYMNTPAEYWKLEFYKNEFCNDIGSVEPNYNELVACESTQDTTYYTVQLK